VSLIQELRRADAERRKEVAGLAREVAARLGDFRRGDAQRRRDIAALARDVASMRADAEAFVGHLHQVTVGRRSEVATMCADTDAFVGHLHQVTVGRRSDVAKQARQVAAMLGDFRKLDAHRRREVTALKAAVATMRADADAFVRHLHRLSADRRRDSAHRHAEVWGGTAAARPAAGPAKPAAARPATHPAKPAAKRPKAARRIRRRGKGPKAPTATAQTATLRDVVIGYLAERPDGARLTDMEREFGMARIQIAAALRGLIDDNKVQKRDLVYFAT